MCSGEARALFVSALVVLLSHPMGWSPESEQYSCLSFVIWSLPVPNLVLYNERVLM
jgi:hypothetical protein